MRTLSREKARMPKMKSMSTSELRVRLIWAVLLIALSSSWTSSAYSSLTRSSLFSRMRSANATCSTASLTMPSGFSSFRCSNTCLTSTTVRMPSSDMCPCTKSSAKKVCATGAGSAKPVVSMMMPSRGFPLPAVFLYSFFRPAMRSPRTVQQTQPLFISMMFSSVTELLLLMSFSSIPTSPNSFSMTAIFLPWFASRMWLSSVVFPAPRKPVMIVVGVLAPPPVAWSPSAGAAVAPIWILLSLKALDSGCKSSAASMSTTARAVAPRPCRSSARSAKVSASLAFISCFMSGNFGKKVVGARRISMLSTAGWSGKASVISFW
mmetsp:Transcript_92791/g.289301  ORF Transcript_92791/g.289301 Transcript_92791/m.289301 type:complete len:321 (+) Transcript_92791:660-1622(+)